MRELQENMEFLSNTAVTARENDETHIMKRGRNCPNTCTEGGLFGVEREVQMTRAGENNFFERTIDKIRSPRSIVLGSHTSPLLPLLVTRTRSR